MKIDYYLARLFVFLVSVLLTENLLIPIIVVQLYVISYKGERFKIVLKNLTFIGSPNKYLSGRPFEIYHLKVKSL